MERRHYWPYTNTCLVETLANTRYILCLIPSSIPGLYLPHHSVLDPISGPGGLSKLFLKYPIPGPDWYVQKMIPVKHWFTLLCLRRGSFVCVGKDSCHDITFPTTLIERMKFLPYFAYFLGKTLLVLLQTDVQSICIPRTPPHPPATSSDKQTKSKYSSQAYLLAQLTKW
jgi:hypothetical protein